jgi:MoxR-like ATPase
MADTQDVAGAVPAGPIFTGAVEQQEEPLLPPPVEPMLRSNGRYIPSDALTYAVEVALMLGQPLLLTGEPGIGKTTLAAALAHERFQDRFLEMQVKSDSSRSDLLYRIDDIAIFRDAQLRREQPSLVHYLSVQPLGQAILRGCPPETKLFSRAGVELTGNEAILDDVFGPFRRNRVPTIADLMPELQWTAPERVVVLIDEIDKAPRDTPNDLLEEFDRMSFAIPEFNLSFRPPKSALRPIVIVTSNNEKGLPEAFLRRCAYHHLTFPEDGELRKIVVSRLGHQAVNPTLLMLFGRLRSVMQRPPGIAELLQWLHLAANAPDFDPKGPVLKTRASLKRLVSVLAKNDADIVAVNRAIDQWSPNN